MSVEGTIPAYPADTKWVEHSDSRHPDTLAFRENCDVCEPASWDGIPSGWLENGDEDA